MKVKKRVFDIIQIGTKTDFLSKFFDYFIVGLIFFNLFITFFATFDASLAYADTIEVLEYVCAVIFAIEYILRIWTADMLYPSKSKLSARIAFIFSFFGIIDFLTFIPTFLPFIFPVGVVAFRIFRVVRIFRLFRINAQYDAYNVITNVLKDKKDQLISSFVIIIMLMFASSLSMYSLEHEAQPEAFANAFSGIWWSVSTVLTVGYGDIYPITLLGRILAIVIAFLGVGIVAIPTGIMSAGFVEHYSKIREMGITKENEQDIMISKVPSGHVYNGKSISELMLPPGIFVAAVVRDGQRIGDVEAEHLLVKAGDELVLYKSR